MYDNNEDFKAYLSRVFGSTGDLERLAQITMQRSELVDLSSATHLLVLTMKMVVDDDTDDAARNVDLVCRTLADVSQQLRSAASSQTQD